MSLEPTPAVPRLRLLSPERTAAALRAHLARHNRRVLLLVIGTLLLVVGLWITLYAVCAWLLVLALTVLELPYTRLPRGLPWLFAVAGACAVGYAWLLRRLTPTERPSDDIKAGTVVADFLLAIPRLTLSVGGTLAAWQRLSLEEIDRGAELLCALAAEKRLPLTSIRREIPDPSAVTRILFALQITQIIDLQRIDGEFFLKLNPLRPPALRMTGAS